ncbi:uncharacterized protein FIBRA_02536 [Fibroporia radiculosa]|uniref:Calcineurin-like phosphoesterase domain-containing protein n=1 Tax=Fibroporia radiculosa TaxID=599839 RepID=J4HV35_9APHY|nr:uncharacterized protein FIBRA_02536 [Fibroporia radiculosa]CCM00502.1 predicted protein [Fibroporia radiculosa]
MISTIDPRPRTVDSNTVSPSLTSNAAAIYLEYDIDNPPPHPGSSWTRFVCISDTHSHIYPIPPGDVLLHSGDLSTGSNFTNFVLAIKWLSSLHHPVKIVTAGNHDLCLDNDWREDGALSCLTGVVVDSDVADAAQMLVRSDVIRNAGIYYLEHEAVEVTTAGGRTWRVYGSPAAPRNKDRYGAFQYKFGEGKEIYDRIPPSTEVLLTHTPPLGTLDKTKRGQEAGCKDLATSLASETLVGCRLHVFGHIHEAHGARINESTNGRVSVNAALAHCGQAVIVDLRN